MLFGYNITFDCLYPFLIVMTCTNMCFPYACFIILRVVLSSCYGIAFCRYLEVFCYLRTENAKKNIPVVVMVMAHSSQTRIFGEVDGRLHAELRLRLPVPASTCRFRLFSIAAGLFLPACAKR